MVCPHCAQHAVVARVDDVTLLRCDHCLARELRPLTSARPLDGTEPTFGAQLWATTTVGRELLWVTNGEHLSYLQAFVAARLRHRSPPPAPLSWYLPAWLQAGRRRDEVLRGLDRLRTRLAEE